MMQFINEVYLSYGHDFAPLPMSVRRLRRRTDKGSIATQSFAVFILVNGNSLIPCGFIR